MLPVQVDVALRTIELSFARRSHSGEFSQSAECECEDELLQTACRKVRSFIGDDSVGSSLSRQEVTDVVLQMENGNVLPAHRLLLALLE